MRQCQSSAQGTDAARMTSCYFKAESALRSSGAQQAVLETVCQGGSYKSIEYGRIFNETDKRCIELAVAVFYKTYVETDERVRDVFGNRGEPPQDFPWRMPSFRAKLQELAKKRDMELGAESVEKLTRGSHAEHIGYALPSIAAELLHLHELVLPFNEKFEPVEHLGEGPAESAETLFKLIPSRARECVERCSGASM
eukprot:5363312-Pyramimonas_sp.AAC.1